MERSRHCPLKVRNTGVSKPAVDPDQAEAEWEIFLRILHRSESGLQNIVTTFLASSDLVVGFQT